MGPGCTDETLLSAIASALHTSTMPITGQLSAAVEKNPGVWLNTAQPLCKAFMVTDEDIRYWPVRAPVRLLPVAGVAPVCESSGLPTAPLFRRRSLGVEVDVVTARARVWKAPTGAFPRVFDRGQTRGGLRKEREASLPFGDVLGKRKWLFPRVDMLTVWPARLGHVRPSGCLPGGAAESAVSPRHVPGPGMSAGSRLGRGLGRLGRVSQPSWCPGAGGLVAGGVRLLEPSGQASRRDV